MAASVSFADADAAAARGGRQLRRRAFDAARRHSRMVRRLRVLLPAFALLAVAGFVALTSFSLPGDVDLSAARLSVTRNSIIMESPRLTGFDGERREYALSADRAIQALTSPDQVRLESIAAPLVASGHGETRVTAEAGDYDHARTTLRLYGAIALDSAEGYALRMTDADIDFAAGTMTSPNPVRLSYRDSEIVAERLSVSEGGKLFRFEGGVVTRLLPPKRDAAAAPAPAAAE
jgi:lipopolysaccharide export system protein LptC